MATPVPIIYATSGPSGRVALAGRLWAAAVAIICLAVLVIAAHLAPNPAGAGSHTRLGLAPCSFLDRTGVPCPSCGMTTSFAWMVRGNLLASAYVQPMGMVLAFLSASLVWVGGYIAVTGRPVHRVASIVPSRVWLWSLLTLGVVAWAWKIGIHLAHLDGWPRPR